MTNFDDDLQKHDLQNDLQKKGAVSDTAPSELSKPLDANNTIASNQRAIILQALKLRHRPQSLCAMIFLACSPRLE